MVKENKARNCFELLTEEEKKESLKRIHSFFYDTLPTLAKLSEDPVFKALNGNMTVASIGVEGALEAFIELFEDGILWIELVDKTDYTIAIQVNGDILLLHESTEKEDLEYED